MNRNFYAKVKDGEEEKELFFATEHDFITFKRISDKLKSIQIKSVYKKVTLDGWSKWE